MPKPASERKLGDRWASWWRTRLAWVQKLPASGLSGVPDWLLVEPGGTRFYEAKRRLEGRVAFKPAQLTRAQRFFLDQVARHGGRAGVVVLDEVGFVELKWQREPRGHGDGWEWWHDLTARDFEKRRIPYDER